MYIIDGSVAPREDEIYGRDGERGLVLTLKKVGDAHESGIFGLEFPYGQTGVFAVGAVPTIIRSTRRARPRTEQDIIARP